VGVASGRSLRPSLCRSRGRRSDRARGAKVIEQLVHRGAALKRRFLLQSGEAQRIGQAHRAVLGPAVPVVQFEGDLVPVHGVDQVGLGAAEQRGARPGARVFGAPV